jgi:hypothetical protein
MSESHRLALAVEMLRDDPDARRAVLTWPSVPKELKKRADIIEAWAKVSHIEETALDWLADALFAQKICLDDRTVDPMATRVIEHMAAEFLRRRVGRARPQPKDPSA